MTRKEKTTAKNDSTAAFFDVKTKLEIWGTNSSLAEKKVTLEVTSFDLDSEWTDKWSEEVVLSPNSSTELFKGALPGQPTRTKYSQVPEVIIVSARLLDEDGSVLARYSNWCVFNVHHLHLASYSSEFRNFEQARAIQIHQVPGGQGRCIEGRGWFRWAHRHVVHPETYQGVDS